MDVVKSQKSHFVPLEKPSLGSFSWELSSLILSMLLPEVNLKRLEEEGTRICVRNCLLSEWSNFADKYWVLGDWWFASQFQGRCFQKWKHSLWMNEFRLNFSRILFWRYFLLSCLRLVASKLVWYHDPFSLSAVFFTFLPVNKWQIFTSILIHKFFHKKSTVYDTSF